MPFADHFSPTAAAYANFRPRYPDELFSWLAAESPDRERAWDCATGSGQAATGLASHFRHVVATDPSVAQLAHADRNPRITYAAMTAERSAIGAGTVALVTVAQALHWFDRPAFYAEVNRVLRPGGLLAVWSYALGAFGEPALDRAIRRFYTDTVGPFWPAERALIDAGYGALDFPFEEVAPPMIPMQARWTLDQLAGYLSTWSAVRRAREATGGDPLPEFVRELTPFWGLPGAAKTIRWPLEVRAGRRAGRVSDQQ